MAKRTLKRDVKLKDGRTFSKGSLVEIKFFGNHTICEVNVLGSTDTYKTAITNLPFDIYDGKMVEGWNCQNSHR